MRAANYWAQLGIIASAYLGFYLILFILIGFTTWNGINRPSFKECVRTVGEFLFLDSGKHQQVNSVWGLANKFGVLVLTAFSSSVLTSKMIGRQSKLRFSKLLVYYSKPVIESEQSKFSGECLVLRLLNESVDDLYNVVIAATLRYYDVPTRTFQHYTCRVINRSIPVLSVDMPFRIYIEMGDIVSAIYTRRLCFQDSGEGDISMVEIGREILAGVRPAKADRLIVYVEGVDINEGKQTTTSHSYLLGNVKEGKFASIEPRGDGTGFDSGEIKRLFDEVTRLPPQGSSRSGGPSAPGRQSFGR